MPESNMKNLAGTIIGHSLALKRNDKVFIDVVGESGPFVKQLFSQLLLAGTSPYIRQLSIDHLKLLIENNDENQWKHWYDIESAFYLDVDAYIGIRSENNLFEFSDIPGVFYERYRKHFLLPLQHRMAELNKWLILKSPGNGLAQIAQMSLEKYSTIFYRSCNLDYRKLALKTKPLQERLGQTDRVRIVSPGTDLSFSVKNIANYFCDGKYNLPDGELFTAPIVDSVEGRIRFNVPTSFMGMQFNDVCLEFSHGIVTRFQCDKKEQFKKIISTDEGASRAGEFGIGLNPYILRPMNQLLFDEKMSGSIHIALGQAYGMAYNGNESAIHWDFVLHQSSEFGGGELYFDDVLIRKDGKFILPDLAPLNTK
ncbi:aminopeptidase [Cohnella soli]|uniref:Aminopeptidase n=1 Tax=Cohnella soli TaxID=425005 RepID=A0ABW0I1Z0_9BACL